VSAAAEVYITIDASQKDKWEDIELRVSETLDELGFDTKANEHYEVGRNDSGMIIECKGYSVAYGVFLEEWAEKLTREIHVIDETTDMEVYVYNLDREADVCVSSRYLFGKNRAKLCDECGEVHEADLANEGDYVGESHKEKGASK